MKIKYLSKYCVKKSDTEQRSWLENSCVSYAHIRDVDHPMTRLIEEWRLFDQQIIEQAMKQWRSRLQSCVREEGGQVEHQL